MNHLFCRLAVFTAMTLPVSCSSTNHASSIQASCTETTISNVSELFVTVEIEFKNPKAVPCEVSAYEVQWKTGLFKSTSPTFVILPGQTVKKRVRIYPDSGNLAGLTIENGVSANVVKAVCKGKTLMPGDERSLP